MINTINHKETDTEKTFNTKAIAEKSYEKLSAEKNYDLHSLLTIFEQDYNLKYPGFLREIGKWEINYLEQIKQTIESFDNQVDTSIIALKLQEEREKILENFLPKDQEKAKRNLDFIGEFTFCTLIPYEKKKRGQPLF